MPGKLLNYPKSSDMSALITKTHAYKIQKKLGGEIITKNKNHDRVKILVDNVCVASFGIRRGSKRSKGHGHIPKELKCSPRFCRELADCTKSQDDWIDLMRNLGKI